MKNLFGFCAITAAVVVQSCSSNENATSTPMASEPQTYQTTTENPCLADSSWFDTNSLGQRTTQPPKEGKDSPFNNNKTVSNCDFHRWSWQKFLWLTKPVNGRPLFLDSTFQVTSYGHKIIPQNVIVLTGDAQASSATDVLKTNPAFSQDNMSHTVYYSIHMNDKLYNTMDLYASTAIHDPDQLKDKSYPVGALELKIAWVNAKALKSTDGYFVTRGTILGDSVDVALLGMHVVGIVENHPEFVWATFQHHGMAPKYDWANATPNADLTVSADKEYLFFNKDTTATVANLYSGNGFYKDIFSLYEFGTPVQQVNQTQGGANTEVFMETSQKGEQNYNNIKSINQSVANQLTGVWNNYFYNGSIWIDTEGYSKGQQQDSLLNSMGYNISNVEAGNLPRGSVAAYNITMETYVQAGFSNTQKIHNMNVTTLANCFSCHSTPDGSNKSPLNFSHVFKSKVKYMKGMSPKEIKAAHVKEIWDHAALRKQSN